MKINELKIPTAGSWARDCLLTKFDNGEHFQFEYNKESDNSIWRIFFNKVAAYKVISEQFSRGGYLSELPIGGEFYFYEIIDSPWIKEFGNIPHFSEEFNHYVFRLYDETIEVITDKFFADKI